MKLLNTLVFLVVILLGASVFLFPNFMEQKAQQSLAVTESIFHGTNYERKFR